MLVAAAYGLHRGCTVEHCSNKDALRIAAIELVRDMLDRLATKRAITPACGHKASADAVRAVADELAIVVTELDGELKLRDDVANGRAAKC